jgi:hypothetical protein
VTFWECKSKTTEMLVVVNALTLHPGQALDITFTVRNQAAKACDYTAPCTSVAPGATASTLQAGPCGSLGFAQLPPDATVSGTGAWSQTQPNSSERVPVGPYTLVVDDRHFTFPLHVLAH